MKTMAALCILGAIQAKACDVQVNVDDLKEIALKNSDHRYLSLRVPLGGQDFITVAQLNTAKYGVFKIFPGNEFSGIYRRHEYLAILHDKKQEILDKVISPLWAIAIDPAFTSMEERNKKMEEASWAMIPVLQELGLPATKVIMGPLAAFNPEVPFREQYKLRQEPSKYVAGPSFWYEDPTEHVARIRADYQALFGENPDVALAQEVQFGKEFDIDFTKLHEEIMAQYPDYGFINPAIKPESDRYESFSVIYYNKKTMQDVGTHANNQERINSIKEDIQARFGKIKGDDKIVVAGLTYLQRNACYAVMNVHAEYRMVNPSKDSEAPHPFVWLNEFIQQNPPCIFGGDINMKAENEAFTKHIQTGEDTHAVWELTPEPAADRGGNPTFDGIIIHR